MRDTTEFRGFELRDLRIVRGFPDDRSLAIVPGDPTGSLEALHSELVHRVYRRSAASNYTLGLALPSRDPDYERARRMIRRYRAPYILQRFHPHFTLLTQVPPQQMELVGDHLQQMFLDEAVSTSIRVEKLAVMARPQPAEPWRISKEIELG